jgi:hypothetical protein
LGGLLLILGIQTRWVALALSPILVGAIWVHSANGWLFASPDGGWEYPLYLFVLCIAQAPMPFRRPGFLVVVGPSEEARLLMQRQFGRSPLKACPEPK